MEETGGGFSGFSAFSARKIPNAIDFKRVYYDSNENCLVLIENIKVMWYYC